MKIYWWDKDSTICCFRPYTTAIRQCRLDPPRPHPLLLPYSLTSSTLPTPTRDFPTSFSLPLFLLIFSPPSPSSSFSLTYYKKKKINQEYDLF